MKITICGSVTFFAQMETLESPLMKLGFNEIFRPLPMGGHEIAAEGNLDYEETAEDKAKLDLINMHYHKILKSDCVLIANYTKKDIPGYIGGNTFLEMGFAYVNGKPIFMLNPIPDVSYRSEIEAMQPIILDNDLCRIKEYYSG